MTGVDWEKAYHDLESHIGQIMKETSELVNGAAPKLRINDVHVSDRGGTLEVIIDATGNRMTYAVYVIDRKGRNAVPAVQHIPSGCAERQVYSTGLRPPA